MSIAVGSVTKLHTHSLYAILQAKRSWYDQLTVDENERSELNFRQGEIGTVQWAATVGLAFVN